MSRPSDLHWSLIGGHSYELTRRGLAAVAASGAEYVLAGGWAVFAHVPRVPSVDLDLFVPAASAEPLRLSLQSMGLNVGPGGEVEFLDLDGDVDIWGIGDPDLGIPSPSYRARNLFEGRTMSATVALDPPIDAIRLPTRAALAVTKLGALHNRDLSYRAHGSGRARMLLGPSFVPQVLQRSESHYLRKAGKDLLDLSLLLSEAADRRETERLLNDLGLRETLEATRTELDGEVIQWARDAADRVEAPDPVRILAQL